MDEHKANLGLTEYMAELKKDLELTQFNLKEKALLSGSLWAKWLEYLFKEKENLNRISEAKLKILKSKGISEKSSILKMKDDDIFLASNEIYRKLNKLQKITRENIDYLERALNILSNFGYQIKNCLDWFKLNSLN